LKAGRGRRCIKIFTQSIKDKQRRKEALAPFSLFLALCRKIITQNINLKTGTEKQHIKIHTKHKKINALAPFLFFLASLREM
jgi:hypothetical protein